LTIINKPIAIVINPIRTILNRVMIDCGIQIIEIASHRIAVAILVVITMIDNTVMIVIMLWITHC